MGHGNSLTDHKKGMIDAFEKDGHSQREIAKKINRSRCAVNNYIKNKNKTPPKIALIYIQRDKKLPHGRNFT